MGTHTHHPWLVTEVVDGLQGVDTGETSILHAYDQVAEVLILGHAEGMLPDKHKVWPEGTGEKEKAVGASVSTRVIIHLAPPISKVCNHDDNNNDGCRKQAECTYPRRSVNGCLGYPPVSG